MEAVPALARDVLGPLVAVDEIKYAVDLQKLRRDALWVVRARLQGVRQAVEVRVWVDGQAQGSLEVELREAVGGRDVRGRAVVRAARDGAVEQVVAELPRDVHVRQAAPLHQVASDGEVGVRVPVGSVVQPDGATRELHSKVSRVREKEAPFLLRRRARTQQRLHELLGRLVLLLGHHLLGHLALKGHFCMCFCCCSDG